MRFEVGDIVTANGRCKYLYTHANATMVVVGHEGAERIQMKIVTSNGKMVNGAITYTEDALNFKLVKKSHKVNYIWKGKT